MQRTLGLPDISRRNLLAVAAGLVVASPAPSAPADGLKVCIFSKHLQFLQGEALATGAAEIGFDGIDISVRKAGHVEPAQVGRDLPALVGIIHQHGLDVPMITADIVDADSPFAEDVLRTMVKLGIHRYRWGGFTYDYKFPLAAQLDALKPRVAKLAALNKKYGVTAMYHTHSGAGVVGASIWDLYIILRDFDPDAVAVNYDVGHATLEGGLGGWINSFYISKPHLRGIAMKDCMWTKNATGRWNGNFVPLGTGMVHFQQYFGMLKEASFSGPVQLHFEYRLGGAENGSLKLTMSQNDVFAAMKRDLQQLRTYLKDAQLAG
jgi:sugar phosphate isomerase/epimerase